MSPEDMENFFQRLSRMSEADISVLDASLKTPGSAMTTTPGSANDLLWTDMAVAGWMSKKTDSVGIPGHPSVPLRIYAIEPAGIGPIGELLGRSAQHRAHVLQMVAIANDLYDKVIPQIFQSLRSTDIPWNDCMTILGGLVSETVKRVFKKEHHQEVLNAVTHVAKHRLGS